jgi:hypothetical protein
VTATTPTLNLLCDRSVFASETEELEDSKEVFIFTKTVSLQSTNRLRCVASQNNTLPLDASAQERVTLVW